jgi:thioesterase domain-containing protein
LHDNFFDLGGDSLLVKALLTKISESEGRQISLIEFLQDPTVRGVCDRLAPQRTADQLRLVVRAGFRPALYCIPGSHGNVLGFFRMAQYLDADQPVTAFQLPKTHSRSEVYSTQDLAARYVDEILAMQPEGPYHLLGACTGGTVAYEMASQLRARGKAMGLLALMDCYNHPPLNVQERLGYRFRLMQKRLAYHRSRLRGLGFAGAALYLGPRVIAFGRGFRERAEEWAYRMLPGLFRNARVVIRRAAAAYEPPDWPGTLELFCVEEPRAEAYDYPGMGWDGKAKGGIRVHSLPGSHMAMLSEPAVQILANQLRESLAELANSGKDEPFALGAGSG